VSLGSCADVGAQRVSRVAARTFPGRVGPRGMTRWRR
jgi:hypothetical protein